MPRSKSEFVSSSNDKPEVENRSNRLPEPQAEDSVETISDLVAELALPQNFATDAPVKKLLTHVAISKPKKKDFFRVRPGASWRHRCAMLKDHRDELWFVAGRLVEHLGHDLIVVNLLLYTYKNSGVGLWPLRVPGDGAIQPYLESEMQAAEVSETSWTRIVWDADRRCYDVRVSEIDLGEPEWPEDLDFNGILNIACRNRMISAPDHVVLQKLEGRA